MSLRCAAVIVTLFLGLSPVAFSQEKQPPLVLHVIRLKPGEAKVLELELPSGPFRPGTRDLVYVDTIPKRFSSEKEKSVWLNGGDYFAVGPGVEMRWQKSGISVQATSDAAPATHDLRVRYSSFAAGEHVVGLRVVIGAK